MIKNYIKIAWRNLLRNRLYAVLNVAGLSLGLACALIVFWFIRFQTTHDHFHEKADRIYQITTEFHFDGNSYSRGVPAPMYKAVKAEMPDYVSSMCVENYAPFFSVLNKEGRVEKKFRDSETVAAYVQPSYFDIFDVEWKSGSSKTALAKPNTVVISKTMAEKFFGKENPVGKQLRFNNQLDFEVTGIVADPVDNTDLGYDFYISFETLIANPKYRYGGSGLENWGGVNSNTYCFIVLPEKSTQATAARLLAGINKKYHGEDYKSYSHPVVKYTDIHHSERYYGPMPMKWIYIMGAIGVFLIVTACFNFINMATAQALKRAREVGVRKAVGSTKGQVFTQFMLETALITTFSVTMGTLISAIILPHVSELLGRPGAWPKAVVWTDPLLWFFLTSLTVSVTLLAGSYPGAILSGFRPVQALKGSISTRQVGGISLRRGLIVCQFVLIQLLVICTLVVNNQVDFMISSPIGYETKGIASVTIPEPRKINQTTFQQRLVNIPGVEEASLCLFLPTTTSNNTSNLKFDTRQKDELWQVNTKTADHHYIKTFGLELVAGENIPMSDTTRGYLINEKVVEKLGLKNASDAIGKNLKIWDISAPIYGVVRNWNNTSLQNSIDPVVIFTNNDSNYRCGFRLNTKNLHETMAAVEKLWTEYFPDHIYEQNFLDEQIAKTYETENVMLKLIRTFSMIAIFIGCLGLYGLVKFMASQKTKEIGVRKVLGASLASILGIFGKEIGLLIAAAFLIAAPLGYYLMHAWLEDYEYRIGIGAQIMIVSVAITLVVAALTAGYESIKAALTDPVRSLRSE